MAIKKIHGEEIGCALPRLGLPTSKTVSQLLVLWLDQLRTSSMTFKLCGILLSKEGALGQLEDLQSLLELMLVARSERMESSSKRPK